MRRRTRSIIVAAVFLVISKILDAAIAPLTWALAALLAALLLARRPRLAAALTASAILVLAAFSSEPVANRILRYAESSAVRTERPDVTYDAVIVLGGSLDPGSTRRTGELQLNGAAERFLRGFEVVRSGHARNIVFSSGIVAPVPGDRPEAEWEAHKLVEWGVPPDRVVAETQSRNTRENAVETARIVRERGWRRLLLVTSAAHMARALGCFARVGLAPDALPVDYRGGDGRGEAWFPRAAALVNSTDAIHELVGRVVYAIVGYSGPPDEPAALTPAAPPAPSR